MNIWNLSDFLGKDLSCIKVFLCSSKEASLGAVQALLR